MSRFDYRNTSKNTSVVDPDHSSPIINYRKDAKRGSNLHLWWLENWVLVKLHLLIVY